MADLPLTFLDHRIQCGNSLVGWALGAVPPEIPAEAYQTKGKTPGDPATKEICASARARNAAALAGQGDLLTGAVPEPDVRLDHPALWREEERVPADIARKAAAYADYLRSLPYRLWDAAADLWLASFFWTGDFGDLAPITTDYHTALRQPECHREGTLDDAAAERWLATDMVAQAGRLADQLNAFHWPLRFPEIAERGGFDYVTGNPPWEVVKLNEQEWFATRDATIAATAGDARKRLIADLPRTNPPLAAAWRTASAAKAREADFMRHSGRYARSGNEPNTYLLFAETDARHTRPDGRAGVIVKSSLGIDKGGQGVLRELIDRGRVEGFYDIVNGGRGQRVIFTSIAEVERFAVLVLGPDRPDAPGVAASMMNWSIEEAREREPVIASRDDLRTLNPVTLTLPSFREPEHWRIALRLHAAHPTLDFDRPTAAERANGRPQPTNPWGLRYATLFHSSGAAEHFLKREDLEADGWILGEDMIFRRDGDEALPLYEGQLANRYDHRARTYAGFPIKKKYGRKPAIRFTTDDEKSNPAFEIEPRYWVARTAADERLNEVLGDMKPVGFRDVGATWTNRRSARAALIPRFPATHKLPVFGTDDDRTFEFVALFNSTPFDFLIRGKMPGGSVALTWMLSQVPAP
ncbi:MAG: hypothetical protein K2Q09_07635, partial [Phycisphaerales bacterium]|nr:hypothetical protein [Phycisphaerales bacterium]